MANKYLKAIREKCLDCCCFSSDEVAKCTSVNCPLYRYRFGKNPDKRQLSQEEMEMRRQSMLNARKSSSRQ